MEGWVIVDDTDAGILYNGAWFPDNGGLDTSGNLGAPFLSTVHGINYQGTLSYNFSGETFNHILCIFYTIKEFWFFHNLQT